MEQAPSACTAPQYPDGFPLGVWFIDSIRIGHGLFDLVQGYVSFRVSPAKVLAVGRVPRDRTAIQMLSIHRQYGLFIRIGFIRQRDSRHHAVPHHEPMPSPLPDDPTRILVAGDTHGYLFTARRLGGEAVRRCRAGGGRPREG